MKILVGPRELTLSYIGDARLLICEEAGISHSNQLEGPWRQVSLDRKPLAVLDPPKPLKGILPREGNFFIFTDRLPADWVRWAEKYKINPTILDFPAPEKVVAFLTQRAPVVPFTPEAAEWYVRVVGCSNERLQLELRKLLYLGYPKSGPIGLDELMPIVASQETLRAELLLKALGTQRGIELARQVPEGKAYGVLVYLEKALEHRKNGWGLLVKAAQAGADKVVYNSYWDALQILANACFKAQQKSDQLSVAMWLLNTGSVVYWED